MLQFHLMKNNRTFLLNWMVAWLLLVGLVSLFSASIIYIKNPDDFIAIFFKQLFLIFIGILFWIFILKNKYVNYINIKKNSWWLFIIALLLQLMVFIPGVGVDLGKGAYRWLDFKIFSIQPSELFRLMIILFYGNIFYILSNEFKDFKFFLLKILIPLIAPIIIIFLLIHDFGSLMIISISLFSMILYTKVNKLKLILTTLLSIVLLLIIAWNINYTKTRLETYLFPSSRDVSSTYYQQSNMTKAIGSGQVFGNGYAASMQKFNHRIPEAISDGIFPIFAEEWGFVGTSILLLSYWIFTLLIVSSIKTVKNLYQRMVINGLAISLVFPAFYNISATTGIVPLSGIPLTFMSKGGTSIIVSLISIAIIILFIKEK